MFSQFAVEAQNRRSAARLWGMNKAIELHDTSIVEILISVDGISIRFAPAYLHLSEGRPGVDAGTGWTQDAILFVANATVIGKVPPLPCVLESGCLAVGNHSSDNMIALPLETSEPLTFTANFMHLDFRIDVEGSGGKLELLGTPRYVERFPPNE
jgi:hypothetical protein